MEESDVRIVPIRLYRGKRVNGELQEAPVVALSGFSLKATENTFGVLFEGKETHWWYYLTDPYAERPHYGIEPKSLLKEMGPRFFFDWGGNGSPVWATKADLRKAFKALGLI